MKTITTLAVLVLTTLLAISGEVTGSVGLTWAPNSEPDIAGYVVYRGTSSRTYDYSTNVGMSTLVQLGDLTVGTKYFFAVTAKNTSGHESLPSLEVEFTVPSGTVVTKMTTVQIDRTRDKILISWSASPVAEKVFTYEVQWRKGSETQWATNLVSSSATTLGFVIDATISDTYFVQVRPIGPAGPGPWLERAVPGLPSPTGLTIAQNGVVTYTWKP